MARSSGRGRRGGAAVALLGALALTLAGCSGSGGAERDPREPAAVEEPEAPPVRIAIAPGDGAQDVATWGELAVSARDGVLTGVTVTGPDGEEVPGELSADGTGWEPDEHLANDARYTVTAAGENGEGAAAEATAAFETVAADATFGTEWNVPDGAEVGVGMELSVTFDEPIEDTAAVRDAIRVTADSGVEVRGHWFGTQRLDFRPEKYWAPGTEVSVAFRLRGVEGAPGVYGTLREDVAFTIGRAQVSTVDVDTLTMEVVRDGELLRTLPVTTGAAETPTWNGRMVVTEKLVETRMDGSTVGFEGEYDIEDVPHAMRLSTSGTFIHGNYWAPPSTFGSTNASHGCVGLEDEQGADDPDTPGAWFFAQSMVGDVVEVINSADDVIAPDNGLNGWNMDWDEWGAGQ
ncbi:L,D-transpeptidase [Streptomyces avicenniae]|uniref:L,D-transpeptidase n=1 Tax=Streptomyces avicenniae TaxID=500153 RepID=UPI00069B5C47|nr:Ig-like domain-containing protein [Streptomyces avicenniae]